MWQAIRLTSPVISRALDYANTQIYVEHCDANVNCDCNTKLMIASSKECLLRKIDKRSKMCTPYQIQEYNNYLFRGDLP